jgi:hypothetical protein
LEKVTYLRKYIGHLTINNEYTQKYFSVSFLDEFLMNLGKAFKLIRKNPGAILAQEEIQNKMKFKKKDQKRKKAIISSINYIPENNKWGEGFFKIMSNRFGVSQELLRIYQILISSNAQFSYHKNFHIKVNFFLNMIIVDSSTLLNFWKFIN